MKTTSEIDAMRRNAHIYALRLLTIVNRGSQEILKRLLDKGYSDDIARDVVKQLEAKGVLNDSKLSRETVRWAVQGKRIGRLRLKLELKKRGIRNEILNNALEDYSPEEERKIACELAGEKWIKLSNIELRLRKKRVYDYLVRRGFNFEMAREVLEGLDTAEDENS